MDIDDKELFSSAMTADENPEAETPAEVPAPEAPQQDDRPRDEHGRFAPKQTEAEQPQPEQQAGQPEAKDEANVPSWRLREVREEAERRVAETEARWQRHVEMLQRQNQPKPEPTPAPDLFENPSGAIEYGARQLLTPIEQRIQAMEARVQEDREANSQYFAIQQHGEPTVRSAYEWLVQASNSKNPDPDAVQAYNRAMQSKHPYDVIVQAYRRSSIVQQIEKAGGDPDKWVMQRAAELQAQQAPGNGRQQSNGSPQGSIVKLPPSLKNVASSQVSDDGDDDTSDAAMFRHAMR